MSLPSQPYNVAAPIAGDPDLRFAVLGKTVAHRNLGHDAAPLQYNLTPTNPLDLIARPVGCQFLGTNGYLRGGHSDWRIDDEVGTLSAWVLCRDVTKGMCILASSDEATDNYFFEWIVTNAGVQFVYVLENGVVIGSASGTTALEQDVWHHLAVTSDGSNYLLYANGEADPIAGGATDSGAWFADVTTRDNVTVGALQYNSGLVMPWEGEIKDVRAYSRILV